MSWPRFLPWFARRYDFTKAAVVLARLNHRLRFWGTVIPVTRHGGIVIGWMDKSETFEEAPTDD